MAETLSGLKRTHYCAKVEGIGNEVVVMGFVQRIRDKGGIIFIDLRDRTGIVQLVLDESVPKEIFEKAKAVKSEFVLAAKGILRDRQSVNKEIPTGNVEILVNELRVLSKAQTPPFEIVDDTKTNEELRLKYRYLDLRRSTLQKNLMLRQELTKAARDYFYDNGFLEIETPMMMKSTPEGARDYIIPSRVHNGSFYALPQSPQIYKQLLMVSGFDRYIQIARCFRDEDLRADRQPEFTQIDGEMSFVEVDDILETVEGFIKFAFKKVLNKDVKTPIKRLTFAQAMNEYGSDKPDLRFDMKIKDISDIVKDSGFSLFADTVNNGGTVRGIVAKGAAEKLSRKEIDKLTEFVKGIGAKGLAYIRYLDEKPNISFGKLLSSGEDEKILEGLGCEKGDCAFIIADKTSHCLSILGALRNKLGKQLNILTNEFKFLWITEMPFFEYDEESGKWLAMHHPFTMPLDECLEYLQTSPEKVRAKAYDLVVNGVELLSGSIRINDYELQEKMFKALGLTPDEIEAKFGFLVDAYKYGAPPHGGFGIGLDRLAMIMCGAESLRDVVAFPKVQNASELMSQCPASVDKSQLEELGIAIKNNN
ncbi:MAG: aspartate--tRNA ligase [Clostridiales bacterium]|nr:aspartate--tRNA ligase [Clostridiales bacterium]